MLSYEVKISKDNIDEFLRFCLVGIIATAIHYGFYLFVIHIFQIEARLWTNIAYSLGYLVSWCANLFLTARFTFHENVTVKRGVGFAASHGINYVLHILLLNLFLYLGLSQRWAPVPVYCIVVPINFILVRTVFKRLK